MSPALLTTFVCACVSIPVVLAAFFGSQWFRGLRSSVDGLSQNMARLADALASLDKNQALHSQRLDQHSAEIRDLWKSACQNPACPYRGERRRPSDA